MSELTVEVLGTGCKKCHELEANARAALAQLNLIANVNHITDPLAIADCGVMRTPALRINGQVVSQGKVLSADEIAALLPH
ncbi:thioredoxin family protein [Thermosynechococcus sichuanensis E542]|uniref:Thioredoxin family protein n=1 Tax=Thermosynechococcus sichuanensis E542 TaxID=2016101 RepID=A0A3B7MCL7_9CYAN|nr:thioredoxin family protein [Thermosynechococcus vestitus]AXY68379.1 thioredoxin family protein [Thermosynechococcus vestitus E542]